MLGKYKTYTSFSTNDLDAAREFYSHKLELEESAYMDGVLIYRTAGDTKFIVYIKENHEPATHTVLNFEVGNVEDVVDFLNKKGIVMEQYDEFKTNEKGISTMGDHQMAWFKDPAGNILSLTNG
jgi:catechol 2,3-dioxygenase-like lactoylglutathione lyase family enzyme